MTSILGLMAEFFNVRISGKISKNFGKLDIAGIHVNFAKAVNVASKHVFATLR